MNEQLQTNLWTAARDLGLPDGSMVLQLADPPSLSGAGAAEPFLLAVLRGEVEPTRIAATKWEAARRITAAGFTTTNQANWSRYATRLLRKQVNGGTLTADEQLDADFAEASSRWIDAVRAASDTIEASAVSPFDPAAPWPPAPDPGSYRACPKVTA